MIALELDVVADGTPPPPPPPHPARRNIEAKTIPARMECFLFGFIKVSSLELANAVKGISRSLDKNGVARVHGNDEEIHRGTSKTRISERGR